MAITYVGGQVGGRAGSTSTTNITFALSGGIATTPRPGDLVVIGVTVASQGRTPACAISGYTAGTQQNANGTTYDTSLNKSYKFMGLTPDTTFTLPSTGNIADAQRYTVQVWRGVDPTNPFDVADVVATGAGTGRPNPGSITPTTSGAVVGIIGAGAAATGAAYTAPANYTTNFLTGSTADTNDAMIGSGYRSWTSGAEDPAAYTGGTTNAADSWAAFTYALRPEVSYLPTLISSTAITLGQVASPGAQSITVPADAQVVVVHFACYSASACALSLASDFAGAFTIEQDSTLDESGGVAFAVISSTGSKTITPSWSSAPSEGPIFTVSFIKDVDTAASFVRDTEILVYNTSGAAASVALASRDVDLVLALDKQYDTGEAIPSNPSGWTSILTQGNWDEGARLRSLDSPSDGVNTITSQSTNFSAIMAIAVRGVASAPIPYTVSASLSTVVQVQRTASTSASTVVQAPLAVTATLTSAVRADHTAATSLSTVVRVAQAATASVASAVRADHAAVTTLEVAIRHSGTASVGTSAAVQIPYQATATVSSSISQGYTVSTSIGAYIETATGKVATTSMSAAVQQGHTDVVGLNTAVQAPGQVSTSLSTAVRTAHAASVSLASAIRQSRTAVANIESAILEQRAAAASVSGAVRTERTAATTVSGYIETAAGQMASTSLSAAVREGHTAITSLAAAVTLGRSAEASVDAAISRSASTSTALSAHIGQAFAVSASLSATVQAASTLATTLSAHIQTAEAQYTQIGVDAAIRADKTATTSLSAAVRDSAAAEVSLSAVVQQAQQQTASLSAYVRVGNAASTALSAAISAATTASLFLAAYVQGPSPFRLTLESEINLDEAAESDLHDTLQASSTIDKGVDEMSAVTRTISETSGTTRTISLTSGIPLEPI